MPTRPKILGQLLVEHAGLSPAALDAALVAQQGTSSRLGETLTKRGSTTGPDVARALALQLGLREAPSPIRPDPEVVRLVTPDLARAHRAIPISLVGRTLRIAMEDPLDLSAVDDLRFQTGKHIEVLVAPPGAVAHAIEEAFGSGLNELVAALPSGLRTDSVTTEADLEGATRSAPVVRLVNSLLRRAVEEGASDVHVEETGGDVRVRYRVDGVLKQATELPAAARRAVLSRIKVMAGMDISVSRRAQDGRIDLDHGARRLTLRASTLPVNGGEKAVLRILDSDGAPRGLGKLGLNAPDLAGFRQLLQRGEGVVLVAGPTGCGKSTTIFSALSEVDRSRQNVVTLEDPVEYRLPGANQIQVDSRSGLDFAAALRAVLRQDPDVVMVGEIRDRETAEIAMAAAVTGHLVLSTIHTTDAPGAITRLLNMGVPPFLVSGGLSGVLAQRLVRRICPDCRGRSCAACGDGHRGRTGIFQLLSISDPIRDAVSRGEPSARIRALAGETGMGSLSADARRAVAEGLTTPHEISHLLAAGSVATLPCSACSAPVPLGGFACPTCGAHKMRTCACGKIVERGWSFCPWCVRRLASVE